MKRWLALAALAALGCSGSPVVNHDQLESEIRQLHSLDEEMGLVEEVFVTRHVPRGIARKHAAYLFQTAREHGEKLAKAQPGPGDESALTRARADAVRLEQRSVALMLQMR
jgi:hypothetical protein